MFIYALDKDLREKLLKAGFKLLKEDDKGWLFVFNNKLKFDFSKVDKTKFLFTNRLTF